MGVMWRMRCQLFEGFRKGAITDSSVCRAQLLIRHRIGYTKTSLFDRFFMFEHILFRRSLKFYNFDKTHTTDKLNTQFSIGNRTGFYDFIIYFNYIDMCEHRILDWPCKSLDARAKDQRLRRGDGKVGSQEGEQKWERLTCVYFTFMIHNLSIYSLIRLNCN